MSKIGIKRNEEGERERGIGQSLDSTNRGQKRKAYIQTDMK